MARRRRKAGNGVAVDLFSFLNIMAATIGVQTLLIVVMALQIKPAGQQSVQFLPGNSDGNRSGKQANYVLCQGGGTLLLVGIGFKQTVNRADPALDRFLDKISESKVPQYLVIGVRPDSYPDFDWVRSRAEQRKIELGYEPIDANWQVTLPQSSPETVERP